MDQLADLIHARIFEHLLRFPLGLEMNNMTDTFRFFISQRPPVISLRLLNRA
jgi:hypothetical protein